MEKTNIPPLTRRNLLKAGIGGTAALGLGVGRLAPRARAAGPQQNLQRWLLDHATQGFTLADHADLVQHGYRRWLERQLHPGTIPDPRVDRLLAEEFPSLTMDAAHLYHNYSIKGLDYIPMLELKGAAVIRSLLSERQLYERMCEFWNDHFSIDHNSSLVLQTVFDREVVRRHALGKFPDMLEASARMGAMLIYLNNDTNVVGHAQENYARELMELHSLGVTGPYTEQDVGEVARCFTGWSPYSSQLYYGDFVFRPYDHDYDAKTVLGHTFPAGRGEGEGQRVLRILGRHRSTSEYISYKMCRWLLRYEPSEGLVAKVAKTYRQTDGDIKSMIRVIFDPDNATDEGAPQKTKFKRPFQFVTSLLRATGVYLQRGYPDLPLGYEIFVSLASMGHSPFDNATPDGYADDKTTWSSSVLPRWQFAQRYLDGEFSLFWTSQERLETLVGPIDRENATEKIQELFGDALSDEDLEEVRTFVLRVRPFNENRLREAIALAASSPSFQTY